jgi:hypothetical protein
MIVREGVQRLTEKFADTRIAVFLPRRVGTERAVECRTVEIE